MEKHSIGYFVNRVMSKREHYPWNGQIELTYRCNLNCIHCYCKGSEDRDRELTTKEWKKILDQIHREGCIWLVFSGGEPLLRDDFLELCFYAKKKGFIITLFTNGQEFTKEIFDYLVKYPVFSIEITLNGIAKDSYESITQVEGSFAKVMATIRELNRRNINLILKSNCLRQNKEEIAQVKAWTQENLGNLTKKRYRFKYDPMIYPRLNGDTSPCQYRLSCEELLEAIKQDPDIWGEYERGLHSKFPKLERDRGFLYQCNSWMTNFFINPFGRLKFCMASDKFSIDLKTTPFKEGFYHIFPQVLRERFKTNSKCRDCNLRVVCHNCPAKAYLETGDEEAPVAYFCRLAEEIKRQMDEVRLRPTNEVLDRI